MSEDIGLVKDPHTLWGEGQFDYTIEVGDKEFKVHKHLMASVSDYFKAMLTGGMKESQMDRVRLHGLNSVCVSNIIEFIYTGKLSSTDVDEADLLECAIYLQMATAIEASTKLLVKKVNSKNCFEILSRFENYKLEKGVRETNLYIKSNIEEVMQALSANAFLDFWKKPEWQKAEWELVSILREWINKNYAERHQYINSIMSCVRFGLLTPEQLDAIKLTNLYTESDGEWHDFIDKAEDYHRLPVHLKVLDESEQCTVRGEPVPVCYNATDTSSSVFYSLYDGKSWKQHEALGAPDLCETGVTAHVTVNNFLIVCEDYDKPLTTTQRWHIFDACTLKWSTMASMKEPRHEFALVHHEKHLYALGGHGRFAPMDVIEQYSFETNTWSTIPSTLPEPLYSHTAFVIDNLIYVCGGKNSASHSPRYSDKLHCWDLCTHTWHSKASLPGHPLLSKPRNMMELGGDKVLVNLEDRFTLHIYNPSCDRWSAWVDCMTAANSKMSPEVSPDMIIDRNNNLFLHGFFKEKEDKFNGFARWRVVKPMKKISEVILDNYPAEPDVNDMEGWVSIATLLAIPSQF